MNKKASNIEEPYIYISKKIGQFVRYYYLDKLLRGLILFLLVSVSYLIIILTIESQLWLSVIGRHILFFSLLSVSLICLLYWVLVPLFKYFHILKSINNEQASRLIGNKIKDIDDKLLNLIQLYEQGKTDNELLRASIEQRSKELSKFSYTRAVDFRQSLLFSKYLLIPIIIVAALFFSDRLYNFSDSLNRIASYKKEFYPPAPFQFDIQNKNLKVIQNKSFLLKIRLIGRDLPNRLQIVYDGQTYYCIEGSEPYSFEYVFSKVTKNIAFYLQTEDYHTKMYALSVGFIPIIDRIVLQAEYPSYTKKKRDTFHNMYAVNVPRGTQLSWDIYTQSAETIDFEIDDSLTTDVAIDNHYQKSHQIFENTSAEIAVSNEEFNRYETLKYDIKVAKDRLPTIKVIRRIDSVFIDRQYCHGIIADDYGLSRLELVYYPKNNIKAAKRFKLPISKKRRQDFYYTFPPTSIYLQAEEQYSYFFRVYDNDPFPRNKSVRSQEFYYNAFSKEELKDRYLQEEKTSLQGLDSIVSSYKKEEDKAFFIKNRVDPKSAKFRDFIRKELRQQKMMEGFTKNLQRQQQQLSGDKAEQLKERLQREMEQAKKRKEMLQQIKKLAEQANPKLEEKLKKFKKENKIGKRNLAQILELTKRNYLNKKIENIVRKTNKLADTITKIDNNTLKEQETYIKEFKEIKQQLNEAELFNQTLRREINIRRDQSLERNIDKDLNDVREYIDQERKNIAEDINKQAAQKLKKLADNLTKQQKQQMQMQLKIDIAALRQLMDNLIEYSFGQEDLINRTTKLRKDDDYSEIMKKQNDLKQVFQHVDDSIYNLSLSQPMITEKINKQIEDVHYYTNATLDKLSERQNYRAASDQQFAFSYINELGAFMSDILDNLKLQMDSSEGGEKGMQLPDIIKRQQEMLDRAQQRSKQQELSDDEELSKEQMEMYKAQQKLKEQLEKLMEQQGQSAKQQAKDIRKNMEKAQKELIEKGFSEALINQMKRIYKKLLDYQLAAYQQGKEEKRESKTNNKDYQNPNQAAVDYFKELKGNKDILLRESLPIEDTYRPIINRYFNESIEF